MNILRLCFFTFLILPTILSADQSWSNIREEASDEVYLLSLSRSEGSTVGDSGSYTSLKAFSYLGNYQNFFPFVDLRYHEFGECRQNAANVGLGFRIAPNFTEAVLGANVYYDYRNIHNHSFNQLGIGVEYLGSWLNFRFNAYLPVGNSSRLYSSKYWARYQRGYYIILEKYANSLRGFNFEAEVFAMKICCTDIFFALGGYYYERKMHEKNILGSECRLTVNPPGSFSLCVSATHDYHYKTRVQGQITFTIPFPCRGNATAYSTWFQPIRRHEIIVKDKHDMYRWNW